MSLHTVKITGTEDAPKIEFACHGDRASVCHQYPDCRCETWGPGHEHPYTSHDKCWMQDWFDNDAISPSTDVLDECDYRPGMSGPITAASWVPDYIEWEFINEVQP